MTTVCAKSTPKPRAFASQATHPSPVPGPLQGRSHAHGDRPLTEPRNGVQNDFTEIRTRVIISVHTISIETPMTTLFRMR